MAQVIGSGITLIPNFFGNGSDGVVTISTNTTLTSDKYYEDLTISSGISLKTGGYRVFVKRLLTLNNNSVIHNDGDNADEASGGPSPLSYVLGGGGNGANGNISNSGSPGTSTSISLGGNGGAGGSGSYSGGAGGTTTGPLNSNGGTVVHDITQALTGRDLAMNTLTGGAGGGSGSGSSPFGFGGGGGGGGGVVVVSAKAIAVSGTATISSNGGSADDMSAFPDGVGGGGGGGGGLVIVISSENQPSGLTIEANGGTGGIPATGGNSGTAGSNGTAIFISAINT